MGHVGSPKPLALCQGRQDASKVRRKGKGMIGQLALGVWKVEELQEHGFLDVGIQARDGEGRAAWV